MPGNQGGPDELHFNRPGVQWMSRAECRNHDPEIWFPERPGSSGAAQRRYAEEVARAQAICATCPVKAKCLNDALDQGVMDGIWGGINFYKPWRDRAKERLAS